MREVLKYKIVSIESSIHLKHAIMMSRMCKVCVMALCHCSWFWE